MQTAGFFERLSQALEDRRIADGIAMLDQAQRSHDHVSWNEVRAGDPASAGLVLCAAEWVDVGYRDPIFLGSLLESFPVGRRAGMSVRDYLTLSLAEALHAMMTENAERAIELFEFVLQAQRELADERLLALTHFWKGRAHRKKGEYEIAGRHIAEARRRAELGNARKLAAVIGIQEAWLTFQQGSHEQALLLLDEAWQQLRDTDDFISLGNIESARGRIVRRRGEYVEALGFYDNAIAIYGQRDRNHRNLARTLVNAAYVKRLMALQLRKRIDSRSARRGVNASKAHANYLRICQEGLDQLYRAEEIYRLHHHDGGAGSVLVNAGHMHLDMGDFDKALEEGIRAYDLASRTHDHIFMARARILQASAENARVEEQLGEEGDTAVYANTARQYSEDAIALARQTDNARLLAGAFITRGMVASNDFFQEWEEARHQAARATKLLRSGDKDHLWEELLELKARILRSSGVDETLRAWSSGMVENKTFQQITEEFAEIVIPKVWVREGKKVSRVAERLSVSPKKVRRILRNAGLLDSQTDSPRRERR